MLDNTQNKIAQDMGKFPQQTAQIYSKCMTSLLESTTIIDCVN